MLQERVDVWLGRPGCGEDSTVHTQAHQRGGRQETTRGTHRLLADRSKTDVTYCKTTALTNGSRRLWRA